MRFVVSILAAIAVSVVAFLIWASHELGSRPSVFFVPPQRTVWNFQAIDTMKYSRDLAREKLHDASFDAVIERQTKAIADTGATHIAIATPYDAEFLPFLERWVAAARRYNLHIWYRGNWSGWEQWFEYAPISRAEHLAKTKAFILAHPELFRDGDAFTSCPECENGGPGDPRRTGDVSGYRKFLIDEHRAVDAAFSTIGKHVRTNLFSMNGDVARLIMDRATTKALGGIVTVDHYVKTPEQLVRDVEALAKSSGGRIVLGEMGAPIPDIHGPLSETEQAQWISEALARLEKSEVVEGVSYWLSVGGSTALWEAGGIPRQGVGALRRYFSPFLMYGFVHDELGRPIAGATVAIGSEKTVTKHDGSYTLYAHTEKPIEAVVAAPRYIVSTRILNGTGGEQSIELERAHKDLAFRLLELARRIAPFSRD